MATQCNWHNLDSFLRYKIHSLSLAQRPHRMSHVVHVVRDKHEYVHVHAVTIQHVINYTTCTGIPSLLLLSPADS